MKRLLRVSFDIALCSIFPILSWFVLSLLVDSRLLTVFSLTMPFQFIQSMMKSVFSVGANIAKEKDKNEHAVMTGMVLGILVGLVIYGFVFMNIESYLKFMNMDVAFYKTFTRYSIAQIYLQMVLMFVLNKLYYEGKNELANKYSIEFNVLNFGVLIGCAFFFKGSIVTVITTLIVLTLYVGMVFSKEFERFKWKFNIVHFIKYDSVDFSTHMIFFLIYFFGFSNALSYGEKYATAIAFESLITDTQWDTIYAINTVAKIDISKKNFNYKEHLKNAYKLIGLIFLSIIIMFISMYRFYELDNLTVMFFLSVDIINFLTFPLYSLKRYFLQLEFSFSRMTINNIFANLLRLSASFIPSPFCTGFGQIFSMIFNFININFIFYENYTLETKGEIRRK